MYSMQLAADVEQKQITPRTVIALCKVKISKILQ